MNYIKTNDHQIIISSRTINLPCTIHRFTSGAPSIVETENLIIVNFLPYGKVERDRVDALGIDMNRNIWAFNQAGDLVWQVAPCMPGHEGLFVYDGVFFKDGRLLCGNAGTCRDYELNPVDGSVKRYPDHPVRSW